MRRLLLAVVLALPRSPRAVPRWGCRSTREGVGTEAEFVNYPGGRTSSRHGVGRDGPRGQRSWAFARLSTSSYRDRRDGDSSAVLLVLTPKTGSLPMTLEVRRGDGREIFATSRHGAAADGESVYKSPAAFVASPSRCRPRRDMTGWSDGVA